MADGRLQQFSRGPGVTRFFYHLVLTTVLSMLVILAATGYGIFHVYRQHVILHAEEDAEHLSEVLVAEHRDLLFATGMDGQPRLAIEPAYREVLDRRLRRYLPSFQIVRIKIYSPEGRILFSTEADIIGRIDSDNARLVRALQGDVDSHLEYKESVRDLAGERQLDVDVVETYVPIRAEGEVVGVFEIYRDVSSYRQETYAAVASSVVIVTGILLLVNGIAYLFLRRAGRRLAEAQLLLQEMATTDALTGVLNRGTIMTRAQEEVSRIDRRREQKADYALSFILLDIDHFKAVNDTFGHLTGDQVLREICERIRLILREYDLLGRFGGEEFLVVLPDADIEGALASAERIRQAICRQPFVFEGSVVNVTASLGVATTREDKDDLSRILQRADASLYVAKQRGRNTVASAEEPR